VRDRGAAAPDSTAVATGSGISGMRRRAEAVGGRLTAGPGPDGGFVVHAELPLPVPGPARPADPAVLRNGARP
jgi:signal transduction histidine kinase